MTEPTWVIPTAIRQVHRQQLEQFGGLAGIRDEGMLESALAKPLNQWHYGTPSIFDLAASYAFGIAMNHPFVDGNKRTAFVTSALFLQLNGYQLTADEVNAAETFLALAAGELSEAELSDWFSKHSKPIP